LSEAKKFLAVKEDGKYIGEVMGYICRDFFLKFLLRTEVFPKPWSDQGLTRKGTVAYVLYKEPRFNMSHKECAEWLGLDESLITDELLNKLGQKVYYNAVPSELLDTEYVTHEEYVAGDAVREV
jgi:hypothetical protein